MIKLADVISANTLLISMGGQDQLPTIAAAAIEKSLDLQSRIDRALEYAEQAPSASVHARNMARILDGSITIDDELNEVSEIGRPEPRRLAVTHTAPDPDRVKGKLKPGNGLGGRSTAQRIEIREWISSQGIEIAPTGRIPQKYLDQFDQYQAAVRQQLKEQRKAAKEAAAGSEYPGQMML